jgi:hypothetical protein
VQLNEGKQPAAKRSRTRGSSQPPEGQQSPAKDSSTGNKQWEIKAEGGHFPYRSNACSEKGIFF